MENSTRIDIAVLSRINDEITPLKGLDDLYSSIVNVSKEIMGSQECSLLLYDNLCRDLYFKATTDKKIDEILGKSIPENNGFAWEVVKNKKLILNNHVEKDNRFYNGIDKQIGFHTRNIICIPMMARNEFVGVLEVVNSMKSEKFSSHDLLVSQVIAAVSASAITTRMLNEELNKRIEELTALYEVSRAVSFADSDREFFDKVLKTLADALKIERLSFVLYNKDHDCLEVAASYGSDIPAGTKIEDGSVTAHVFRTGEYLYVNDVESSLPCKMANNSCAYKTGSFVSVPVSYNNEVMGVFNLTDKKNRRIFDEFEIRVLLTLGSQIAGIYNAYAERMEEEKRKRLRQEINIAAEIQRKNLARVPREFRGMTISVLYEPSRSVGGDFFDFYHIDNSRCGLMVADVSGKGIPAAIFTGTVKNILRAENRINSSPAEMMGKANPYIYAESEFGMFATVFYVMVDHDKMKLRYCSAGHNEQLLIRKKGDAVLELNGRGRPLGIAEDSAYEECGADFDHGDLLLLFTDGLVESLGGENFDLKAGYEKIIQILGQDRSEKPEKILNRLRNEIRNSSPDDELFDDLTILAVEL